MNSYEQMRKSVEKARNLLLAKVITGDNKMRPVYDILSKALAIPRRNCDVGTADEQERRFCDFCLSQGDACIKCPIYGKRECRMAWGQMPYTEKGGAE